MAKGSRGGKRGPSGSVVIKESPNRGQPSVDGSMKTAITYHGSFADFDEFDKSKSNKRGSDLYGSGNYFADDLDVTYAYGDIVYKVKIEYSTDSRTAKKTGRKKDYQYSEKNGFWVIPQDSRKNITILQKGKWVYDKNGNRKVVWDK